MNASLSRCVISREMGSSMEQKGQELWSLRNPDPKEELTQSPGLGLSPNFPGPRGARL